MQGPSHGRDPVGQPAQPRSRAWPRTARPEAGSGLRGLADRVASVGGGLRVDSPPGGGTRLEADLPCP